MVLSEEERLRPAGWARRSHRARRADLSVRICSGAQPASDEAEASGVGVVANEVTGLIAAISGEPRLVILIQWPYASPQTSPRRNPTGQRLVWRSGPALHLKRGADAERMCRLSVPAEVCPNRQPIDM